MVNSLIHSEVQNQSIASDFLTKNLGVDKVVLPGVGVNTSKEKKISNGKKKKFIREISPSEQLETCFKPSSWLAKINFINHLVIFNNVLMVVAAEKGAGKTTFMKLLRQGLDADIQSMVMSATPSFSNDDLINQVMDILHLELPEEALMGLDGLFDMINARQSHVLMMIDDAQYLSSYCLNELLVQIKKRENNHFFHVCLFSDFSLVNLLNQLHRAEYKDFIHIIEPGSLSEIETKTYILSHFTTNELEKGLTDDRMNQFYHLTSGNIARINTHLTSFFKSSELKRSYVGRLSFAVVVLGAILINSSYWWYKQNKVESIEGLAARAKLLHEFDVAHSSVEKGLPHLKKHNLSQILPYTVAAVHLPIQPAPLKRVLVDSFETEDSFQDRFVVLDKVVVIPDPKKISELKQK